MAARSVMGLAAAVGMVDGVHRDATALRTLALVAVASGLADLHVLVLGVGKRSDGRAAVGPDQPHLRRREPQGDHLALLGNQLDRGARGAAELAALAGDQLDVMDDGA